MKYQDMLSRYLEQKKKINPRYSLRSFAQYLDISASKLSEIINRKKALSLKRGGLICQRLGFDDWEKNIFLLSIKAQHSATRAERFKAEVEIEAILSSVSKSKNQTAQRAAWYFGAVDYLLKNSKLNAIEIQDLLQITPLQYENASRLIKRVKADNKKIQIEPISSVNKWQEVFVSKPNKTFWEHAFVNLDEEEQVFITEELMKALQLVQTRQKVKSEKTMTAQGHLKMIQILFCQIT